MLRHLWNHMILHRSKTLDLAHRLVLPFWNHLILHGSKSSSTNKSMPLEPFDLTKNTEAKSKGIL